MLCVFCAALVCYAEEKSITASLKEYATPSPPPPPPPKRRTSAVTVSAPVCIAQVFEFSYSNRAGTVSIATEPAAQVSRPDTPFPEQSSQTAGVSYFTPSRPGIVVIHDMYAGPTTSGVVGGGLAQREGGVVPVSLPSPAQGWDKTLAGRGRHVNDSQYSVATPAVPVLPSTTLDDVIDSRPEGSQPAPGSRANSVGPRIAGPPGRPGDASILLSPDGTALSFSPGSRTRSDSNSIGPLGLSSIVPLSGLGTLSSQAGGGVGGVVPSALSSGLRYPIQVAAQL